MPVRGPDRGRAAAGAAPVPGAAVVTRRKLTLHAQGGVSASLTLSEATASELLRGWEKVQRSAELDIPETTVSVPLEGKVVHLALGAVAMIVEEPR